MHDDRNAFRSHGHPGEPNAYALSQAEEGRPLPDEGIVVSAHVTSSTSWQEQVLLLVVSTLDSFVPGGSLANSVKKVEKPEATNERRGLGSHTRCGPPVPFNGNPCSTVSGIFPEVCKP